MRFLMMLIAAFVCSICPGFADGRSDTEIQSELQACGARLREQLTRRVRVVLPTPPAARVVDCLETDKIDSGTLWVSQFEEGGNLTRGAWEIESAQYVIVWDCSGCEGGGWYPLQYGPQHIHFAVKCNGFHPSNPTRQYQIAATLKAKALDLSQLAAIGNYCAAVVFHPGTPRP